MAFPDDTHDDQQERMPRAAASVALGAIATQRTSIARDVYALGWVNTRVRRHQEHLVLPTDVFLLAVHCIGNGDQLESSVALLRTQPGRFRSESDGTLSFALLTASGLMRVLRAPLNGMTESRVPLSQFCGFAEERALRGLLLSCRSVDERMLRFAQWIEARIHGHYAFNAQQSRVAATAAWLQECDGPLDMQGMRSRLTVSQRQLERDFRTWLGVPPATYSRLVRFQRAAQAVASGRRLADTAFEFNFCDQPHLNRRFRELSTVTPVEFIKLASTPARRLEQQALAGRIFMVDAPARNPEPMPLAA